MWPAHDTNPLPMPPEQSKLNGRLMLTHQHPELRDMDRWEAEPLSGMSINEIFDKTLTADELGGNLELDTADRERLHEERIQATAGG
jgi:hypothetical protein